MAQRIQLRRGTTAEWTAANPVLSPGEPGLDSTTGRIKIGDGVAAWLTLPYAYNRAVVPVNVAYAATITPAANADILNVAPLTGGLAVAAPANTAPTDGQTLRFRFSIDATGSRVITWDAIYAFGTDVPASMIPVTASAVFEVLFQYHAASTKWRCVAIIRGF